MSQQSVCQTLVEVKEATNNLCRAHEVPLLMDDGGVMKKVDNFKGIYNSSTGKFCAAVSKSYNLIGHKDYFDNFAEALGRLNIQYKMTIKEQGNKAFADIEFIGRNLKFKKLNEEFTTGIRLVNSYDKTRGLSVIPRYTRLACTNGMIITRSEKVLSIKHHTKILLEMEKFIEVRINDIVSKDIELQSWVSASMEDSKEWRYCCELMKSFITQPKHLEAILDKLGVTLIVTKDKASKKKTFSYLLKDKSIKNFNRWQLYNAVTNHITHGEHITPHIEEYYQKKVQGLLTKSFAELPQMEVTI